MVRVKSTKRRTYKGKVYDIAVKDDHNYTVEDCIVHNSGAGSLVLYTLGVTQVDPLKYNLLFERFLDASRLDEIVRKGQSISGCFVYDTFVKVMGGYKYISQVRVGDFVVCSDGEERKVERVWNYGLSKVIRIVYGEWYFDCTPNHEIYVFNNGVFSYKHAGELTYDDKLVEDEKKKIFHDIILIGQEKIVTNVYDLQIEGLHNYRICGQPINTITMKNGDMIYLTSKEIEKYNI